MEPFAREPATPALEDCYFYHSMDIPGYGSVKGEWDLRGREPAYLGHVALEGKRVLEVGTASGYVCGYMEGCGADVVGYDLSPDSTWDVVPYASLDSEELISASKQHIAALNAGWWLNWKARQLKASVVYGSVYQIPGSIGEVDIVTFGSILLHLRDPFLGLWNGARLCNSTVVVTDVDGSLPLRLQSFRARSLFEVPAQWLGQRVPAARFVPRAGTGVSDTWWTLTPQVIQRMLGVLGFERSTVTYHTQNATRSSRPVPMFTVVAERTSGQPDPAPVP